MPATTPAWAGEVRGVRAMPDADRFERRARRIGADGAGQAGNGFISGGSPRGMLARRIRGRGPKRTAMPDAAAESSGNPPGAERSSREGQGPNYRLEADPGT